MIEGSDGVVNVIDDLLVWWDSQEQHDQQLVKLFESARPEAEQKQMQNQKKSNTYRAHSQY